MQHNGKLLHQPDMSEPDTDSQDKEDLIVHVHASIPFTFHFCGFYRLEIWKYFEKDVLNLLNCIFNKCLYCVTNKGNILFTCATRAEGVVICGYFGYRRNDVFQMQVLYSSCRTLPEGTQLISTASHNITAQKQLALSKK